MPVQPLDTVRSRPVTVTSPHGDSDPAHADAEPRPVIDRPTQSAADRAVVDAAALLLADGFGAQILRFSVEQGAQPPVAEQAARLAIELSIATSAGHTCLPLGDAYATVGPAPGTPDTKAGGEALRGGTGDGGTGQGSAADGENARIALLASGVVDRHGDVGVAPMVLDDQGRLYLRRYYAYEACLARDLIGRAGNVLNEAEAIPAPASPSTSPASPASFVSFVSSRSPASPSSPVSPASSASPAAQPPAFPIDIGDAQRRAVDLADAARLALITGGPGTGKTTTVVAILARWLARRPDLRVALAAPTGKAAARMLASVRERAAALPADIRDRLPAQASTLHRLLGSFGGGRFRHDAGHRLPIDALIVDESSMLDVALAARLVDALPASARLVLLGDADQLSAVEAGAVFAELVGRADGDPSPLAGSVVRLTHSHRFGAESPIGRLAAAINHGLADDARALLDEGLRARPDRSDAGAAAPSDRSVERAPASAGRIDDGLSPGPGDVDARASSGAGWIDDTGDELSDGVRTAIVDGFAGYLQALTACLQPGADDAGAARAAVFAAFDRFRVLAATRRGRRGVDAVNRLMERAVRDRARTLAAQDERSPWYAGRPVLIERNDAVLRLFNGDVGLCLPDDAGQLYVWFAADDGSLRAVAPPRLPAHSSAYAMTIHKSQGSEFDEVLTILARLDSPLNRREAVYTAVTRARRRVTLAGDPAAFAQACRTAIARDGGLRRRLRDALAGAPRNTPFATPSLK
ncbi:MAG TPA: exodeoxyribonuclease V subunit alpha [Burkholderiaceae bacterium]|nr:exodeoxyribonuclease V subunit alpha [Burkholderiaceae bacterium]